ncbi:amidase [Pigmentiphaga litoralis]|uniref:amidase n=1 Tax=Pigmentiphaga litoralis TaxID=516702 RepID=UPI001678DBE3|nr:amidase [Pigmentiphaga litoralis]GGX14051.1 amidase [Pigmentiphaga litoralis]
MTDDFPVHDTVGAWVPHGRFVIGGAAHGPLAGLRFAAKDLYDVAGHVTGAGNPTWLATHEAATDTSPVVQTLLDAGATLVGKTLTDELAYSIAGDNAHYGTPINARAPDRVPGGSSSGSAAAVAAGLVDMALGTDTGGSTRVPASYCGLWGLRTSQGALPSAGLVPMAPQFDTATWLAARASIFERVADVLMPAAPLAFHRVLRLADACDEADAVFAKPIARVTDALAAMLAQTGAAVHVEDVRVADGQGSHREAASGVGDPGADLAAGGLESWRMTYVTASAFDAWQAQGAWITSAQPVFGDAIASRWKFASTVTSTAADAAFARKAAIVDRMNALLGDDGIAVLPSASSEAVARDAAPDVVDTVRTRTFRITCIAGLSGLPQVNLPFIGEGGLPVGVSLMGPKGSDLALIRIAVRLGRQLGCLGTGASDDAEPSGMVADVNLSSGAGPAAVAK